MHTYYVYTQNRVQQSGELDQRPQKTSLEPQRWFSHVQVRLD